MWYFVLTSWGRFQIYRLQVVSLQCIIVSRSDLLQAINDKFYAVSILGDGDFANVLFLFRYFFWTKHVSLYETSDGRNFLLSF